MYFDEDLKIEKRQRSRISFRESVQYIMEETQEYGGSVAHDLSDGGLRLQLNDFVPINTRIVIDIPISDANGTKVITLNGRVAWVRRVRYSDQYQVGLEFNPFETETISKEVSKYINSSRNQ